MVQVGSVVIKHVEGIGIYNIQPGESIFNRRNVGVLFIYGQAFLPVTAYLVFGATTMLEFEQCFFLWISLSATTVGFFVTILKTRNLFETLDYANNFLEKRCEDPIRRAAYERALNLSDTMTRIAQFVVMKVVCPLATLSPCLISYCLYFTTDMGTDAFIMFNTAIFPFDDRTPLGYAVSVLMIAATFYVILYTVTSALAMIIVVFVVAMTVVKDMREHFNTFTEISNNYVKMVEWVRELHNVHAIIVDLMSGINDVLEMIMTVIYIWSMLAISDTLLMFIGVETGQDLIFPSILSFEAFSIIFLFCELGERISNGYGDCYYDFMQIDWYKLPLPVRKIWPIMLHGGQIPISFIGIGSIACTREAFKDVCTRAYSYYSTFKQF